MEGTPETLKLSNRQPLSDESRCRGAIYGLFIGDALAMPVHWYYDTLALQRDYGHVTDFVAPKNPHPDSILWRSSYSPLNEKANILHDQAQYWGKRGIHYHQFLEAGENTLNLKLCALLMESLNAHRGYSSDDYLKRYIAFHDNAGKSHRDTYVEEYHRHFFTNYAAGKPAHQCGVMEKHIGGLGRSGAHCCLLQAFAQPGEGSGDRAPLPHPFGPKDGNGCRASRQPPP